MDLLPHLFRQEYAKMTAVLCRHFGLRHIEVAEDIASDTFLKASEYWPVHGIPENPVAWLYTVAKNKAKDYFKHNSVFESQIKRDLTKEEEGDVYELEFDNHIIADSQLAMIFAVCNPVNSGEGQICLALQILCGFSVEEIANAFLSKPETIKKRLLRARANLREDDFKLHTLNLTEINSRLDTVMKTLYLLFNEGYFSKTNNQLIRRDLCSEAMRLTLLLTENSITNLPQTNALLALMCFQSSRFEARLDENGATVLYEEQDKSLWDQTLIDKGNHYLVNACIGNQISKYHLEAGIAYWHTTPNDTNKWAHILQLYNQLLVIEYSHMAALNRIFAFAKAHSNEEAIKEALKLDPIENSYYHGLLGYLYTGLVMDKAIYHYRTAIGLTKSKNEKQALINRLEQLELAKK